MICLLFLIEYDFCKKSEDSLPFLRSWPKDSLFPVLPSTIKGKQERKLWQWEWQMLHLLLGCCVYHCFWTKYNSGFKWIQPTPPHCIWNLKRFLLDIMSLCVKFLILSGIANFLTPWDYKKQFCGIFHIFQNLEYFHVHPNLCYALFNLNKVLFDNNFIYMS